MELGHCRWNVDQFRLLSVEVSEMKIRLSKDSSNPAEYATRTPAQSVAL